MQYIARLPKQWCYHNIAIIDILYRGSTTLAIYNKIDWMETRGWRMPYKSEGAQRTRTISHLGGLRHAPLGKFGIFDPHGRECFWGLLAVVWAPFLCVQLQGISKSMCIWKMRGLSPHLSKGGGELKPPLLPPIRLNRASWSRLSSNTIILLHDCYNCYSSAEHLLPNHILILLINLQVGGCSKIMYVCFYSAYIVVRCYHVT